MTQFLFTFMAYGTIMIVGFMFLFMLIQVLGFYIAGRLTGSINDEFTSALTLFGSLILLGAASSLVNAVITIFMPGSLLATLAAVILFLFITIYAIVKIYDLSILSAILHFIISFGLTVIVIIGLAYLAIKVLPQPEEMPFTLNGMEEFSTADDEEILVDSETPDEELTENEEGETVPSGPKLPSVAVSDTTCIYDIDCENPNDFCFSGTCQTVEEISSQFTATENCESYACANCATGSLSLMPIGLKTGNYNVCVECDTSNPDLPITCNPSFTCNDFKCVTE